MNNIVLCGFMGCGKSTVGRNLARKTGKRFIDMDAYIEKKTGKKISEIFAEQGEDGFREIEHGVCEELAGKSNMVIATGGGTVLDPENTRALKREGKLIFLRRELSALQPAEDRPLSDTPEKLRKIFERRRPVYEAAADGTAEGCEDPVETARAVLRAYEESEALA